MTTNERDRAEEQETAEKVPDSEVEIKQTDGGAAPSAEEPTETDSTEEDIAFYVDQIQRTRAEFDNFRRRTQQERLVAYRRTVVDVVRKLLPVIDDLDKAIKVDSESTEGDQLRVGLTLIHEKVSQLLKDLSIEPIQSVGANFDPNLHEAMMQVEDDNAAPGEIVEEVEKGYILGDLLVRASRVLVARDPSAEE